MRYARRLRRSLDLPRLRRSLDLPRLWRSLDLPRLWRTGRIPRRLRRLARALPAPIRRPLLAVWRRVRPRPATPTVPRVALSVVVVARDAADHLEECLRALRGQSLDALEVLLVGAGSPDDTTARRLTRLAQEAGVRALPPAADPVAARAAGLAAARGTFVNFLDAGEIVPAAKTYASLVGVLRRTGSDFAAGAVQVVRRGRARRPAWVLAAHDLDRPGTSLAEFPRALQDVALGNHVFRTAFLRDTLDRLGDDPGPDEVRLVVAATLFARRFDLLAAVTLLQPVRATPHRLSTPAAAASAVTRRLAELEATWRLVRDHAGPEVTEAWLGRLVDGDLGDLIAAAPTADQAYREPLQAAAGRVLASGSDGVWPHVRVERKLRLWLAAKGDWDGLALLIEHFRLYGAYPPTEVVDGRILARPDTLPATGPASDPPGDVPAALLELGSAQSVLAGCLDYVGWAGTRLAVHGWAVVRGLDLTGADVRLDAELVDPATGRRLDCVVEPVHREAANVWSRQRYADAAAGGFAVTVETAELGPAPARWQLQLRLAARGVARSGVVLSVAPGAARSLPVRPARAAEAVAVVPVLDGELGFGVHVRPVRVRATELTAPVDGSAAGRLTALDGRRLTAVVARSGKRTLTGELDDPDADGRQAFRLERPARGLRAAWELWATDDRGRGHRVGWPVDTPARVGGGQGLAGWRATAHGHADLLLDWRAVQATAVRADAEQLVVDAELVGLVAGDLGEVRLVGDLASVPGVQGRGEAGQPELRFPLHAARWGGPDLPLPAGVYRVLAGPELAVTAGPGLRLPAETLTDAHRVWLGRGTSGTLTVRLEPPLADDERSRLAQQRLADEYAGLEVEPAEAVLFQSYRGEFATDSQRALHEELVRRGDPPDLVWGVADWSVAVPDGGRRLLIESRAWYRALAASRYLCRNIDLERYFVKRPFQRYLQTFHGYPFKSMGASLWRAQGRAEAVIRREQVRRSSAWDAIVVPEDFCVPLYRAEYGYQGPCLVTGYPRNDDLVRRDAGAVAAEVRRRLGVAADRRLLLYAPTWRDTGATSAWTAQLFDALDLSALAAGLGAEWVVLLRGHNYNLREGVGQVPRQVVDVSGYPEINDLVLAADVAVLDYSSLRFDWLITGKPAVFFVPDLADYLSSRTALFDYEPTAPGPLLSTTAQVVAALLDLTRGEDRYAAARTQFNQHFNRLHDGNAAGRVIDAFF